MLAVCINCWHELQSEGTQCPHCGTHVDFESHSYERLLFWALKNSQPEHRAEVCKILGLRRRKEAVAHLLEAINDHATIVRIAALGALGAIADESARAVVEKALDCESLEVQSAARRALKQIEAARNQSSSIHTSEGRVPESAPRVG
jgi:HEAT repeat protein